MQCFCCGARGQKGPWARSGVILLVVFAMLAPHTMSGCGVNFDKMRKRRIDAIRGQILSKLGFTSLPTGERPPPDSLTREVEAKFNRTRDFVLEEARRKREECREPEDSYYAQEITTVYMKNRQEARAESAQSNRYKTYKESQGLSEFLDFDLTAQGIDPEAIVTASLRLYQVRNPGARDIGEQVELYQLSPPEKNSITHKKRFLNSRVMDSSNEGWVSFDITSTVTDWLRYPSVNKGLELTIPCPDESSISNPTRRDSNRGIRRKLDVLFVGSSKMEMIQEGRGDRGNEIYVPELGDDYNPHLIVMVRKPGAHGISKSRRRHKRALDAEYCFQKGTTETNCCLRELYIDFRRDLGWDWIHAPTGYKANFCAGACPYMWSSDTQYATILSLYKTMNPQASSAPCCTAKELDPLMVMYYRDGQFKFTHMSDMVLLSCKCS